MQTDVRASGRCHGEPLSRPQRVTMSHGTTGGGARIAAVASARPTSTIDAGALGAPFGKDADWVTSRTGINSLARLAPDQSLTDLAVAAGRTALERAEVTVVDVVIAASCSTPPGYGKSIVAAVAPRAGMFEINSACSGFCYALAAADSFVRSGSAQTVLIVAAEQMSRLLDPEDLGTSIIFGDGAGAAVVTSSATGAGIGPLVAGSDGANAGLIANDGGGYLRMQGSSVFRWAIDTVPLVAAEACRRAGVNLSDLDAFVPHQANLRIVDAVTRKLGLTDAVVATDVIETGNTSAASIPLAMDRLLVDHPGLQGGLALLVGFGAGLSYAAQVVELPQWQAVMDSATSRQEGSSYDDGVRLHSAQCRG